MSLESLALLMKILGAAVSLVSGMTAIFNVTWSGRKLTGWGWSVLMALLLGFGFSAAGTVLDAKVKQLDDVATKVRNDATLAQLASIKKAAQTTLYPTTVGASVSLTISIDKDLPALRALVTKLERARAYAISHCRIAGGVASCRDYVIRSVVLDELRFDQNSSLFPRAGADFEANGILSNLSTVVWFYKNPFARRLDLSKGSVGGIVLDRKVLHANTLFEWDGERLRVFIDAKVPPQAFETAGILSIVNLLGGSASTRPFIRGNAMCPANSYEHDCDLRVAAVLRATRIELIEFRFPHRKNILLAGGTDNIGNDTFDVPYVFVNFPDDLSRFGTTP